MQVLQQVKAGQSYLKQTSFYLSSSLSLIGATVLWSLVDDNYLSLSSGTGNIVTTQAYDSDLRVDASSTVSIPSDVASNVLGTAYLLLWKLILTDGTIIRSQETVVVAGDSYVLQGPQPLIGIGGNINVQILLPFTYSTVTFQIYYQNTPIPNYYNPIPATLTNTTVDGYVYSATLDLSLFPGQTLDAYTVVWSYYNGSDLPNQEVGALYYITPSILAATREVQVTIQRAVNTFDNMADTTFSPENLLDFLRMGRDNFNAFFQPTMFTMTNALGPTRAFWLACANVSALRSQFLVESLKKFDFSGQAVTLTVDHAGAFESMAEKIETQFMDRLEVYKGLLSRRGQVSGSGDNNPLALVSGAIGSIGISLSPVSNTRYIGGNNSWLGLVRI